MDGFQTTKARIDEIDEMIRDADMDGDWFVNFDEYVAMMGDKGYE